MHEVQTERLLLRPLSEDDATAWHAAVTSDLEVMKWLSTGRALSLEETSARIPRFAAHWRDHGYGTWAVVDRATGELLGHCGLHWTEEAGQTEVYYALGRAFHGRGIATEATCAALAYGFDVVGLDRIEAYAKPDNAASIRVMEKAGMVFDRHDHLWDLDVVVYVANRGSYADRARPLVREVAG